jgi:hypothetical protein
MIRQARTYFVGAMSGASLIAVAIAVFVLLVSTQVFGDWPVAELLGGDRPSISDAKPAATASGDDTRAGRAASTTAASGGAKAAPAGGDAAKNGDTSAGGGATGIAGGEGGGQSGSGGGEVPGSGGGEGGSGGSAPTPSPGDSGSSGGSGGSPTSTESGTSSGGGTGGGGGPSPSPTTSPTTQVTGTVNETVHQVDETVTGGALEKTGVTGVTEEVVNGVAGPESVVGKTVDETTKTVEGLPGK